ncbi:hypothetical protein PR048_008995 [Dryococelus australis]|uniref:Uncharacterized protein n=1 Tax=Dryococelus australis TaxID=614101 RepID=A0ABQ9HYN6_9NEOP|nr:hypothetical protein PR048_008995 [Dryococelus australis]
MTPRTSQTWLGGEGGVGGGWHPGLGPVLVSLAAEGRDGRQGPHYRNATRQLAPSCLSAEILTIAGSPESHFGEGQLQLLMNAWRRQTCTARALSLASNLEDDEAMIGGYLNYGPVTISCDSRNYHNSFKHFEVMAPVPKVESGAFCRVATTSYGLLQMDVQFRISPPLCTILRRDKTPGQVVCKSVSRRHQATEDVNQCTNGVRTFLRRTSDISTPPYPTVSPQVFVLRVVQYYTKCILQALVLRNTCSVWRSGKDLCQLRRSERTPCKLRKTTPLNYKSIEYTVYEMEETTEITTLSTPSSPTTENTDADIEEVSLGSPVNTVTETAVAPILDLQRLTAFLQAQFETMHAKSQTQLEAMQANMQTHMSDVKNQLVMLREDVAATTNTLDQLVSEKFESRNANVKNKLGQVEKATADRLAKVADKVDQLAQVVKGLHAERFTPGRGRSLEAHISEVYKESRHLTSPISDEEFMAMILLQLPFRYQAQWSGRWDVDLVSFREGLPIRKTRERINGTISTRLGEGTGIRRGEAGEQAVTALTCKSSPRKAEPQGNMQGYQLPFSRPGVSMVTNRPGETTQNRQMQTPTGVKLRAEEYRKKTEYLMNDTGEDSILRKKLCPELRLTVCGLQVPCLLDSGGEVSYIAEAFVNEICPTGIKIPVVPAPRLRIIGATAKPRPIISRQALSAIEGLGSTKRISALVIEGLTKIVILGIDFFDTVQNQFGFWRLVKRRNHKALFGRTEIKQHTIHERKNYNPWDTLTGQCSITGGDKQQTDIIRQSSKLKSISLTQNSLNSDVTNDGTLCYVSVTVHCIVKNYIGRTTYLPRTHSQYWSGLPRFSVRGVRLRVRSAAFAVSRDILSITPPGLAWRESPVSAAVDKLNIAKEKKEETYGETIRWNVLPQAAELHTLQAAVKAVDALGTAARSAARVAGCRWCTVFGLAEWGYPYMVMGRRLWLGDGVTGYMGGVGGKAAGGRGERLQGRGSVWGWKGDRKRVLHMQKRAVRIINDKRKLDSYRPLFKSSEILRFAPVYLISSLRNIERVTHLRWRRGAVRDCGGGVAAVRASSGDCRNYWCKAACALAAPWQSAARSPPYPAQASLLILSVVRTDLLTTSQCDGRADEMAWRGRGSDTRPLGCRSDSLPLSYEGRADLRYQTIFTLENTNSETVMLARCAGETGALRGTPPTNGNVCHTRKKSLSLGGGGTCGQRQLACIHIAFTVTLIVQVDLKSGFQKYSVYRKQPIQEIKTVVYSVYSPAFKAEKRRDDKIDTVTCLKGIIAAKCEAQNWRAVFSSYSVCPPTGISAVTIKVFLVENLQPSVDFFARQWKATHNNPSSVYPSGQTMFSVTTQQRELPRAETNVLNESMFKERGYKAVTHSSVRRKLRFGLTRHRAADGISMKSSYCECGRIGNVAWYSQALARRSAALVAAAVAAAHNTSLPCASRSQHPVAAPELRPPATHLTLHSRRGRL